MLSYQQVTAGGHCLQIIPADHGTVTHLHAGQRRARQRGETTGQVRPGSRFLCRVVRVPRPVERQPGAGAVTAHLHVAAIVEVQAPGECVG